MAKGYLTPAEITDYTIGVAVQKTQRRSMEVLLMAVMAGMYIAMGALAASTASHAVSNSGLAKLVAGVVFPIGLMFVILNGADLFTGNCLIVVGVMDKQVRLVEFIKNLGIVLTGNFIGATALAWMQANGGMLGMSGGQFGAYTLATAVAKTNMGFSQAFILAIMCNIFVCAGVWMIYSATDVPGKLLASFFSIVAFVISGSEHIVANMYYIPAGIFAKGNGLYVELAGINPADLANLTWRGFLINNAIPVTLGNIIGGVIIGAMYYTIYKGLHRTPTAGQGVGRTRSL
ncbi:MAG: formate/nitrite transporter family protein [Firmicutes bacterium]|nr:formate/nitrite transporter family protein [Bacillota bacterium]